MASPSALPRPEPDEGDLIPHITNSMLRTGYYGWGLVIYRTAFHDDAKWACVLELLKVKAQDVLKFYNVERLWPYMLWTIIEDRSLEGASTDQVRQHSCQWARDQIDNQESSQDLGSSARCRYCICVDKTGLDSVYRVEPKYGAKDVCLIEGGFTLIKAERQNDKDSIHLPADRLVGAYNELSNTKSFRGPWGSLMEVRDR